MKRSNFYLYIIFILCIIPFYYLTKDINIFNIILISYLSLIFISTLSHVSIYSLLDRYLKKNYICIKDKVFKIVLSIVSIISLVYIFLTYIISCYLEKIFNLTNLKILSITVSSIILFVLVFKIINEYLIVHNYKKLGNNLLNIYLIFNIIYLLISSLILNFIKINSSIKLIIISLSFIISGLILLSIILFCYRKKFKNKTRITRDELKINYYLDIKRIFKTNTYISLINVIKYAYIYISIIVSYRVLTIRYNYSIIDTTEILTHTYFYSLLLVLLIYLIYKYKNTIILNNIKKIIENKETDKYNIISSYYIEKLSIYLPVSLITLLLSKPIYTLILNNYKYSYALGIMNVFLVFYIIYDITITIIRYLNKNKQLFRLIIIGFIFFLISLIPIIDTSYRMGYPLIIGSVITLIISHLLVTIMGSIYLKKYNIIVINDIEKILVIFYKNILLSIILILLQLIIPSRLNNQLQALFLILFYFSSGVIYYLLKNLVRKKSMDKRVKKC
ncbi:MAG: hypothetical protein ACI312_03400 [Bacilli bacterium]